MLRTDVNLLIAIQSDQKQVGKTRFPKARYGLISDKLRLAQGASKIRKITLILC